MSSEKKVGSGYSGALYFGAGVLLVSLVIWALYWSWCWGWWGRENRWLQYFFQCQCPMASEEARYPDNINVLFSACENPGFRGESPSGRYIRVVLRGHNYLYDQKLDVLVNDNLPGLAYFLTDDLVMLIEATTDPEVYRYILYDRGNNQELLLNVIPMDRKHAFDAAQLDHFRQTQQIYVVGDAAAGLAISLAGDPFQHPDANYVLGRVIANSTSIAEITDILQSNGITYKSVARSHISHSGTYQYEGDDIFLLPDKQLIAWLFDPDDRFYGQTWGYEDQGVIYESPQGVYLIGRPDRPLGLTLFRVPQPLLLLKVPVEYLTPAAQHLEQVAQAQEDEEKQRAIVTFWSIVGLAGALSVLGAIWLRLSRNYSVARKDQSSER